MKDEDEKEAPNPRVGICWYPNTNFYGVVTKPLFDNCFSPKSNRQQGVENVTTTKIRH